MKYYYYTSDDISYLVSRFEHSSQKGCCLNLGENEFLDLVDHYEEEHSFEKALEVIDVGLSRHSVSPKLHTRKAFYYWKMKRKNWPWSPCKELSFSARI